MISLLWYLLKTTCLWHRWAYWGENNRVCSDCMRYEYRIYIYDTWYGMSYRWICLDD